MALEKIKKMKKARREYLRFNFKGSVIKNNIKLS